MQLAPDAVEQRQIEHSTAEELALVLVEVVFGHASVEARVVAQALVEVVSEDELHAGDDPRQRQEDRLLQRAFVLVPDLADVVLKQRRPQHHPRILLHRQICLQRQAQLDEPLPHCMEGVVVLRLLIWCCSSS